MKLGKLNLPRTAALAPMAGVADRAFREICVAFGACYVVGEMASSKGMQYGSQKSAQLLEVTESQRPMGVQIFGGEPETMGRAALQAATHNPDAIDINMGCPAPKIAGGGSGAALMKDIPLAGDIIRSVAAAGRQCGVPVTVKLRKGWDDNLVNAVELAQAAAQCGAAALTVHGRTRAQMYAPPVDLSIIAQVKQAVAIPVIGNGDVDSAQSAAQMYEKTGCDLVMVGRGALGAPWVFAEIAAYMNGKPLPKEPEPEEKMAVLLRQIKLACAYKGEHTGMLEARKHAAWYLKGWKNAAALRRETGSLRHYEDLEQLAKRALEVLAGNALYIDKHD